MRRIAASGKREKWSDGGGRTGIVLFGEWKVTSKDNCPAVQVGRTGKYN
jgi:hypothetical protein